MSYSQISDEVRSMFLLTFNFLTSVNRGDRSERHCARGMPNLLHRRGEERGAGKVQLTTNLRRNYQTFCSNFVVFSHENNPSTCQPSLTRYNMKVGCDSLWIKLWYIQYLIVGKFIKICTKILPNLMNFRILTFSKIVGRGRICLEFKITLIYTL